MVKGISRPAENMAPPDILERVMKQEEFNTLQDFQRLLSWMLTLYWACFYRE